MASASGPASPSRESSPPAAASSRMLAIRCHRASIAPTPRCDGTDMDARFSQPLTELLDRVSRLQQDIQQRNDLEKYEGRLARIEQKRSALTRHLAPGPHADAAAIGADLSNLLIEFVEKVGLLRRDMQQR